MRSNVVRNRRCILQYTHTAFILLTRTAKVVINTDIVIFGSQHYMATVRANPTTIMR